MNTTHPWTIVWEQRHTPELESLVRVRLQEGFDSGALAACPRCRGMEARVSTDEVQALFHAIVECTCLLSDPQKFAVQIMDGAIPLL